MFQIACGSPDCKGCTPGEKSVFAIVQAACGEEKIVGIKYV